MIKAKSEKNKNIEEEITQTVLDLLGHLQVKAEATIEKLIQNDSSSSEDVVSYKVNINTEETGLLIGKHGETINSLQLIIGIILYKKLGFWQRVVIDVGNYRESREESIKEMVERISKEVEETGQPVTLPYLTPFERRVVHLMLSENKKIASESSGEGKDRLVTIKLR